MKIEVYSKPSCVQCTQSKKKLEQLGLEYSEIDIFDTPDAYEFITEELKFRAAPVIVVRNNNGEIISSWAGFNPEKITELKIAV